MNSIGYPMRPRPAVLDTIIKLALTGQWCVQPKYDGKRRLLVCGEGRVAVLNRHLAPANKPAAHITDAGCEELASHDVVLDCEYVTMGKAERLVILDAVVPGPMPRRMRWLDGYGSTAAHLVRSRQNFNSRHGVIEYIRRLVSLPSIEGVVCKRLASPYRWHTHDGDDSPDWLKWKGTTNDLPIFQEIP